MSPVTMYTSSSLFSVIVGLTSTVVRDATLQIFLLSPPTVGVHSCDLSQVPASNMLLYNGTSHFSIHTQLLYPFSLLNSNSLLCIFLQDVHQSFDPNWLQHSSHCSYHYSNNRILIVALTLATLYCRISFGAVLVCSNSL